MSVHPELNQYLKDVLSSVRPLLEEGAVERTVLAIHNKVSLLCVQSLLCVSNACIDITTGAMFWNQIW